MISHTLGVYFSHFLQLYRSKHFLSHASFVHFCLCLIYKILRYQQQQQNSFIIFAMILRTKKCVYIFEKQRCLVIFFGGAVKFCNNFLNATESKGNRKKYFFKKGSFFNGKLAVFYLKSKASRIFFFLLLVTFF